MDLQSYITWNIRGANCPSSRLLARDIVRKHRPAVLCLQETKCAVWTHRGISSLGYHPQDNWVAAPSCGQSGGLLTVWDVNVFTVSSYKCMPNWILIKGVCKLDNRDFAIVNVYAPQAFDSKKAVWKALDNEMSNTTESFTVILGDFNTVRDPAERINTKFKIKDNIDFNQFIASTEMVEVCMRNSYYTWFGPSNKCSKLDRIMVSKDWLTLGNWLVIDLDRYTSDHRPLCLTISKDDWGPKPYKFFNYLLEEQNFVEVLKQAWTQSNARNFISKFRNLRGVAKQWSAKHFGDLDERLKALGQQQNQLDQGEVEGMGQVDIKEEMDKLLQIKVSMLCQKSRLNWELKGERNTRFFHRALARRQHRNQITALSVDGVDMCTPHVIKEALHSYFHQLLTETTTAKIFDLPDKMLAELKIEEREHLIKDFTLQEIHEALLATDATKSPGSDGINAGVLRSIWPVMKDEILVFFKEFHTTSHIPKGYNASFIALVPKVKVPKHPTHFRPISLMNSVMKLLSKVMARRLKEVMHVLVSPTQSAFIQGRQITDSILLASEVISALKDKKSSGLVLKIDFEKAFDKIRWNFVFEVLRQMNFDSKWIDWISSIFNSSSISVLVNGSPSSEFSPTRGLRQGDPLSPLLFNLVGEVLSAMLNRASELKIINGISLPNCKELITHLQFADDVVLFISQDIDSIMGIKRVLQCFQVISGLKINFSKSSLYGYGGSEQNLVEWAALLGCEVGKGELKYLGATLGASPTRLKYWDPLLAKVQARVQSYDSSTLSIAGRTVLLKAVIDSIPVYWFSLFKIPSAIINKIEKVRRRFLWGGKAGIGAKRTFHSLSWNKVCSPKRCGGLGLVPIRHRNEVLLAKWVWRAYNERDRYWNKLLGGRDMGDNGTMIYPRWLQEHALP